MDKCIDKALGDILHAYELGILSEEDRERFEVHLLECRACFEKASSFQDKALYLRKSEDVRRVIREIDGETGNPETAWSRIVKFLWPESPRSFVLKPLTLLVLLCVLTYPVYRSWFDEGLLTPVPQTLNLFPLRGESQGVINLEKGGEIIVNFVYEKAISKNTYRIRILSREGVEVYSDDRFSGFNRSGMGSIKLPVTLFSHGYYTISIDDPATGGKQDLQVYNFRAE